MTVSSRPAALPRRSALVMGAGRRLTIAGAVLVPLWLAVWWSLA